MKRWLLPVFGALALSLAAPALAASPNLPTLFATQIKAIKSDARAPAVLLPTSMPVGFVGRHAPAHLHLYPEGGPRGATYQLDLGALPKCGGAESCNVVSFDATKAGKILPGFTTVTVPGASQAQYHGLLCGASCSNPQIEYIVHGVLYTIQGSLTVSSSKDQATMIAAAEASIKAGPR